MNTGLAIGTQVIAGDTLRYSASAGRSACHGVNAGAFFIVTIMDGIAYCAVNRGTGINCIGFTSNDMAVVIINGMLTGLACADHTDTVQTRGVGMDVFALCAFRTAFFIGIDTFIRIGAFNRTFMRITSRIFTCAVVTILTCTAGISACPAVELIFLGIHTERDKFRTAVGHTFDTLIGTLNGIFGSFIFLTSQNLDICEAMF